MMFILGTKKQTRYSIFNIFIFRKYFSFYYKQLGQNIHSYHIIINSEDSLRLSVSRRGGMSALKFLQYC